MLLIALFLFGIGVWLLGTGVLFVVGNNALKNGSPIAAGLLWVSAIASLSVFFAMMERW